MCEVVFLETKEKRLGSAGLRRGGEERAAGKDEVGVGQTQALRAGGDQVNGAETAGGPLGCPLCSEWGFRPPISLGRAGRWVIFIKLAYWLYL